MSSSIIRVHRIDIRQQYIQFNNATNTYHYTGGTLFPSPPPPPKNGSEFLLASYSNYLSVLFYLPLISAP